MLNPNEHLTELTSQQLARIELQSDKFEVAWERGEKPRITDFLNSDDIPRTPLFIELVLVEMELRLKNGESVRVEDYQHEYSELSSSAVVLPLILTEIQRRSSSEEHATLEEYIGRFPELSVELRHVFGDQKAEHAGFLGAPSVDSLLGQTLGVYRLDRMLAEGGMGVVYSASRTDYAQRVAIKLIRQGMVTPSVIHRFETERQILAAVRHPNVTQLYDGGTTADGLPYIVMEFVEGLPIDVYCDNNRLTVRQRIELFIQVCHAVQFAHQNLIIHRDLKPSNILVTTNGDPKLMDFGIAKLLTHEINPGPEVTQTVSRFLTPVFASPEQHRFEPLTTASDVYSLGAILYKLVTGRSHVSRSDYASVQKQILAGDWTRPSRAAVPPSSESKEDIDQICRRRDVSGPARLSRILAGDLDKIIMTALSPEPNRRYSSAVGFAEDLERYLAGRAVRAQKGSLWYHSTRFVARNKLSISSAVLTVILASAALWQYSNVEQRRREREAGQVTERLSRAASDLKMAKYLIHQGQFETALDLLTNAEENSSDVASLEGLNDQVQQIQNRLTNLNEFYGHLEKSELYGVIEYPYAALRSSEAALSVFDVLENDQWFRDLPDEDLLDEQKAQLLEDVHRQIILHAVLTVKDGLIDFGSEAHRSQYEKSLAVLEVADTFRPSHSGELLRFFCRMGLGQRAVINPERSAPSTATDFYFSGMLHLIFHILPNDPLKTWIMLMSKQLSEGGIDVLTPLDTSINNLSVACSLRPNHYWAHYWLGLAHRDARNHAAAENAFNACIGLDPTVSLGYLERAEAILLNVSQFSPSTAFDRSYRALADLQYALELNLNDPYMLWRVSQTFVDLTAFDVSSEIVLRAIQIEQPITEGYWGRHYVNVFNSATDVLAQLGAGQNDARYWSGAAVGLWKVGNNNKALKAVQSSLAINPREPLSLLVRARINIESQRNIDESIRSLESVLEVSNIQFMAHVGLAQAYELKSDRESSIKHWQECYQTACLESDRLFVASQLATLGASVPKLLTKPSTPDLDDVLKTSSNTGASNTRQESGIQMAYSRNHLKLNPKFLAIAYFKKAQSFMQDKDGPNAIAAFSAALKLIPSDPVVLANRASAHLINDDIDRARNDISRSLDALTNWQNSRHIFGHILFADGQKQEALEQFEYNSDRFYQKEHAGCLASLYQDTNDHSKAIECLSKAIKQYPDYAPLYELRAASYSAVDDKRRQERDLFKAQKLSGSSPGSSL